MTPGAGIKPDQLCMIVGSPWRQINGRTCTTVCYVPVRALWFFTVHGWAVSAPWIDCAYPGRCDAHVLLAKWLVPINDPDLDLTEDYPQMLEDALRGEGVKA